MADKERIESGEPQRFVCPKCGAGHRVHAGPVLRGDSADVAFQTGLSGHGADLTGRFSDGVLVRTSAADRRLATLTVRQCAEIERAVNMTDTRDLIRDETGNPPAILGIGVGADRLAGRQVTDWGPNTSWKPPTDFWDAIHYPGTPGLTRRSDIRVTRWAHLGHRLEYVRGMLAIGRYGARAETVKPRRMTAKSIRESVNRRPVVSGTRTFTGPRETAADRAARERTIVTAISGTIGNVD